MREQDAPTEPVHAPLVPASVTLPEITLKAVVLSILLAAVLAGANAYLGLFAGMTVSASIPAAVVSMAVLRLFRQSNILENNIVQTAASSGEALAAGVIFTIPGLVLIGYWTTFDYWQTFTVSLVGGVLGVLFTIPLRRALIIHARLRFPEGVATAEVLKVGASSDAERVAGRGRSTWAFDVVRRAEPVTGFGGSRVHHRAQHGRRRLFRRSDRLAGPAAVVPGDHRFAGGIGGESDVERADSLHRHRGYAGGWGLDPVSGAWPDLAESASTPGAVRRPQPI